MTRRAQIEALIARLEGAKEGSRELDAEIAVAAFQTIYRDDDLIYAIKTVKSDGCAAGTYWRKSRSGMSLQTAPEFTRSVDAALTLARDGAEALTILKQIAQEDAGETVMRGVPRRICIAALRARLAEMKESAL